jgi:hypothetical protein
MVTGYLFSVRDNRNLMEIDVLLFLSFFKSSFWPCFEYLASYRLVRVGKLKAFMCFLDMHYSERENETNYLIICDAVCMCVC